MRHFPPGETCGIHVNSASFLFKTRGDLAEFMWFCHVGLSLQLNLPSMLAAAKKSEGTPSIKCRGHN